ncbi:MAG: class I SAM-dependent methyltransferase [Candidatus Dormibacteraeota bacterium]|nr:class I SAM-dependent methyltransferase [Candidatus Dormibacteraeota bacterium]MBO0744877.1 class I SAM-dependent methyltransferase [Candidatus Dormibacteraeota bacterium]
MDVIANADQARAWNGYEGEHWAANQDRWDAVNGEFNEPLLEAAAIGEEDAVLDVGCGNGQTTRLAARRATRGRALGLDLSGPMLARALATTAAAGIVNATYQQGDAQVHAFAAGEFDVAISRFGIMFFSDPVAAFANVGRSLRPGGRLAFLCMQDLSRSEVFRVPMTAIARYVRPPDFSAGGGPGMFSLADPARITEVLTAAGYARVVPTAVERPACWGDDASGAAAFFLESGPAHALLANADADTVDRVRGAITDALGPYERAGGVRLPLAAWLVTASRPEQP